MINKSISFYYIISIFLIYILLPVETFSSSISQKDDENRITGYIYDAYGNPLPNACICTLDEKIGAIANEKGFFEFNLPKSIKDLKILMIGFKTQFLKITDDRELKFYMEFESKEMESVVIVGYYTKNRTSFTGTAVSVEGEKLRNVNNTSFFDALKVFDPSFQIVDKRELNGSNPNYIPDHISIRGENSFPEISESELKTNVSLPIFLLDGFETPIDRIYDLDMNRIESVTILKDASASAIYGSRAANGVVVIETISPQPGVLKVNYTLTGTLQIADLSSYNLMNSSEIAEFQKLAGLFNPTHAGEDAGIAANMYNLIQREIMAGVDIEWIKKPVRNVFQHRHSLIIDGSVNSQTRHKMRYSVNLSYSDMDGLMKGSDRQSYGLGTKLIYNNNNLRITNDLQFSFSTGKNSPYGNFSNFTTILPYLREKDTDGNYYHKLSLNNVRPSDLIISNALEQTSPVYEAKYLNSFSGSENTSVTDNLGLNWTVNDYLRIKGNFSVGYEFARNDVYISPLSFEETRDNNSVTTDALLKRGKYKLSNSNSITFNSNIVASFSKDFNRHFLQVILGGELKDSESKTDDYTVTGFLNDALNYPNYGIQYLPDSRPGGSESTVRLAGMFSNINYSFGNKYLIDLTGRIDGSSLYGREQMYTKYWSTGLRWNIDNETFLYKVSWIDLLALRMNIGITGNQNYSRNQAVSLYNYLENPYGNFFGVSISTLGNPDLKGQETLNRNIGFEFSIFKKALNFNINYYNNITRNNLTDITIAPSIGFSSYKTNMGNLTNKGVDFSLSATPVRTKDLLVSLSVNGAHNKNKITKISESLKEYNETVNQKADDNEQGTSVFLFEEGKSMNTIYAVRSLGIDPGTGKEIYLSKEGEKTYDWKAKDQVDVGNTEPTLSGYCSLNVKFKDWELGSNFNYSFGADMYNYTLYERIEGTSINNRDRRALTERWKQPGDIAKYKSVDDQTVTKATSRFVQKENKFSMTSLRLTYSMPNHMLRSSFISMLRMSITCNDVFYASTVKQERGLNYPYARVFTFSTQLNF